MIRTRLLVGTIAVYLGLFYVGMELGIFRGEVHEFYASQLSYASYRVYALTMLLSGSVLVISRRRLLVMLADIVGAYTFAWFAGSFLPYGITAFGVYAILAMYLIFDAFCVSSSYGRE